MSNSKKQKFVDPEGNAIIVDEKGSLGLLAYGYKGLLAWREHREKTGYKNEHLKAYKKEQTKQKNAIDQTAENNPNSDKRGK